MIGISNFDVNFEVAAGDNLAGARGKLMQYQAHISMVRKVFLDAQLLL